MAFSESIKKEVRRRTGFQCCICRGPFVEVHHIIPVKDGGTDYIDNAAPLCPNCHAYYGNDPEKRKEIINIRDWWYERVKDMYGPPLVPKEMLEEFSEVTFKYKQLLSDFEELKSMVKQVAER